MAFFLLFTVAFSHATAFYVRNTVKEENCAWIFIHAICAGSGLLHNKNLAHLHFCTQKLETHKKST